MGIDFKKLAHFLDSWVWFFVFIGEPFGISRIMGMIFRKFSGFMGIWVYLSEISPDKWVVLLRFEWHNLVSWKLK